MSLSRPYILASHKGTGSKWCRGLVLLFIVVHHSEADAIGLTTATQRTNARHGHFDGVIPERPVSSSKYDLQLFLDLVAAEVPQRTAKETGALAADGWYPGREPVRVDVDDSRERAARAVTDVRRLAVRYASLDGRSGTRVRRIRYGDTIQQEAADEEDERCSYCAHHRRLNAFTLADRSMTRRYSCVNPLWACSGLRRLSQPCQLVWCEVCLFGKVNAADSFRRALNFRQIL